MPKLMDPFKLPSLRLSQLKELPPCVAIYFAIDEEQRVLYVGKTKNLNKRWKNHDRIPKLQEMDKESPVAIAWKSWNPEGLDEAEKYFISTFQPLLNGTKVISPEIIPSEVILRDFLTTFSKKLIILGINQAELTEVILKYKWAKPLSTANEIKEFIKESNKKNSSLKFRWKRYITIKDYGDAARPGSRRQKFLARRNNAYNNHWQLGCNGVRLHITPAGASYDESYFGSYQELKKQSKPKELAGIKIQAVTSGNLAGMGYQDEYFFSNLSCYEDDIVSLLWSNS